MPVKTITMDSELNLESQVRLLKMDLEGAEEAALRGASKSMVRIEAILFEQLPGNPDVASLLRGKGYQSRAIDGANWIALRTEK